MTSIVKRESSYTGVSILLLFGLLAAAAVSARQPIIPLQLSFSDPGARSMGFGGAFVALADDATAAFANPTSLGLNDQTIDDVDELHLGAEYFFLGSTPIIAVRLGTWLDPDHQMRATSNEPLIRTLIPRGDDEVHFAAGIGVAMQQFQIDLAMDFADRADTFSLSAIYSF